MLGALGRVVSFEACCQWALYVVCKSLDTTLLFTFTVGYRSPFILLSVKCMQDLFVFSVIHPNFDMDYRIFNVRT